MQADVKIFLIKGPRQEGRIDRNNRTSPDSAIPAAEVIACCSAMPTSMNDRGTSPQRATDQWAPASLQ